jgi:site-specific recombinase XerD
MIKQNFYLKSDKVNHLEEHPIYLKLSYQGKSTTIRTGKWITKERWRFTNKLRKTLKMDKERNCKIALDRILEGIENVYYELLKTSENLNVIDIKNKYTGKSKKAKELDIIELFSIHNKYFEKMVTESERSKASLQKYERAKDLVSNFIKHKYGKHSFPYININNDFIYSLESYMKYESVYKEKKGISNNSVFKYFKSFKTMCNYAIKMEFISKNPFQNYDGKLIIKDAVFLTQEELSKIENKEISNKRLNKVRDIFLFSTYTSYAPVDAEKLTTDNLIKENDGTLWIKTNRTKTRTKSNVPILPPVERIINRYEGLNDNKLLPRMSNQKVNAYLKEIADLCGINKKLTHYVARHTFATTVTLGNGVSIENVSSMMGHTRLTTTQHYAKVLDKNVKNDMNKLRNKFC